MLHHLQKMQVPDVQEDHIMLDGDKNVPLYRKQEYLQILL